MAAVADLQIYNSLSRTLEPFVPAEPGKARMYVCGMTVYDYCHIGHARAMLSFDVVYRWLLELGLEVTYIRNYTDVDDKIIERAAELGEPPLVLSARFIAHLDADLEAFGLALPTHQPKVSDHIPGIVALNERLIERGHAYAVDGDVYFAVTTFEGYGKLSGKRLDDLRSGERVEVDGRKRHPGDFALWKSAKEGEVSWDSPWGKGRPGWHIECSVMAMAHLGETFDIHGGGIDLIFPHHENEIAQSEAGTGHAPFARYWMHNGHVNMGEAKMSKSLGNFIRIRDILGEVPAEALRLLYLEAHYRSPLPYSADRLAECMVALDRLYAGKEVLQEMAAQPVAASAAELCRDLGEPAQDLHRVATGFSDAFARAMNEDFNTAAATGALFELVRVVNRFGNNRKWRKRAAALAGPALDALALSGRVLGVGGLAPEDWFEQVCVRRLAALGITAESVQQQVDARLQARATKDWAEADRLRDALVELGVVLMDGPQGTRWRMKVD